jgi:hypothetical protein
MPANVDPALRRIPHGVAVGLQFAIGYTVIATLILGFGGELTSSRGWNVLLRYAAVYFFAGTLGGAFYGLLLPLTKTRGGLMLVLSFVGLTIYPFGVYTYLSLNDKTWEPGYWLITAVVGIGFGIGAGHKIWETRSRG